MKKWFIGATTLIVLGTSLVGLSACSVKGDLTKLGLNQNQTITHEITEEFTDITIVGDTEDVLLLPSEDEKCTVVCVEEKKLVHSVSVEEGVLSVKVEDTRRWYDYIDLFDLESSKITVYLPQNEYGALNVKMDTGDVTLSKEFAFESIDVSVDTGDVSCFASATESITIKTSTGNIDVGQISAGGLNLSVSSGKITVADVTCEGDAKVVVSTGKSYLSNVTCKNLISTGNTGNMSLQNVVASEKLSIERTTGNVTFDGCDAEELFVETSTGDVSGSLLTTKVFIVNTNTGKIQVPESITGGKCKIVTSTGDIRITIQ